MNTKKVILLVCMLLLVNISYAEDLFFNSYHIYTSDEDKYMDANVQNDSLKICINEMNQEIELYLYNQGVGKWTTFYLKINDEIGLGYKSKIGTLYACSNNVNHNCRVCIIKTDEGTFIDMHNFFFLGELALNCWVKSDNK